eukprot:2941960-Rhodomonas_salina.1
MSKYACSSRLWRRDGFVVVVRAELETLSNQIAMLQVSLACEATVQCGVGVSSLNEGRWSDGLE